MRTLSATGPQAVVSPRPSSAAADRTQLNGRSTPQPLPQSGRLRTQRSLTNLPRSPYAIERTADRTRIDALPPLPPLPLLSLNSTKPNKMELYERRNESAASISSASSGSSYSTTHTNSWPSSASSDTSLTSLEDSADKDTPEPKGGTKPAPGFGTSLWSRVAAAAGGLSVSVSRAWEANIEVSSGEVTPPGEESRLTRAIKSYHIEKARQPSDLPDWLFSERERGVRAAARSAGSDERAKQTPAEPKTAKRIATPARAGAGSIARKEVDAESAASASRATQKLRELRDAKVTKRIPTIRFVDTPHPRHAAYKRVDDDTALLESVSSPPLAELPEPRLVTNVRPVASLKSVGRRPNAVGLPSSVRPRTRP
ncbi:uncharacterized protein PHACADRAFT_255994 [Phanerochaete carnosa HHB-10118-sp]|uniref:Uncharacterized protein n=1 Tax=Phanerochaete carnosa (strain HHB-10118-sp) TaxID=650164 RepID=K5VV54_PHACS|nr:uncharacterized protein PHACADRAFT_255994 [Phanerochaete carnosa HHB-10118-sp]EKM55393.1 hypothetical protein PHACADRAFT_255994 [Phanerochaete carnosa HHB-10118-sp]